MDNILKKNFYSPTCGNMDIQEVMREITNYLCEKQEKFYEIIVGSDSSSGSDPCFPVAIVVLRKGEGGRFFLKKVHYNTEERKKFRNWKARILQEVMLSCQLAIYLREKLETKIKKLKNIPDYEFKYIHADVGEKGATKEMIKEVIGLIKYNGFEAKIKPESFVASGVADKYC